MISPRAALTTAALALLFWQPLAGSGKAVAQPQENGKLRAFLVIDTEAKGIERAMPKDRDAMVRVLEGGFKDHRNRLEMKIITGKDVDGDKILKHYQELQVDPSDILLFYDTGHGATDPKRGQYLSPTYGSDPTRATLRSTMEQKRPRSVIILTDCCGTYLESKVLRKADLTPRWDTIRCLLLDQRGVVDINACTEGEAAWVGTDGSLFTLRLAELFCQEVKKLDTNQDGFVHWQEAFPWLQDAAQKDYADFRRGLLGSAGSADLEKQLSMTAQAYALPPAWRFGARAVGGAEGVRLAEVHGHTPAAVAGLRTGDVVLRIGQRPINNPQELTEALAGAKGDVLIRFRRGADNREVTVKLAPWKSMPGFAD